MTLRRKALSEGDRSRRSFLETLGHLGCLSFASAQLASITGCIDNATTQTVGSKDRADLVFGKRGLSEGRFQKPRALAITKKDEIYVADKTGRIQAFDQNGEYLLGWQTPRIDFGKPTGLSIDPLNGNIIVADTHYFQFLSYKPDGTLESDRTIGGVNGSEPGQFSWVTDYARSPNGDIFLAEYGEFDRIYKYSKEGQYIARAGEHGDGELQFSRPQSIGVDNDGLLWVADSCNHRIVIIDWRGEKPTVVNTFGGEGEVAGKFRYPYGLVLAADDRIIVSEFGNHRVQLLTRSGTPISQWGAAGSLPGQLNQPWAVDLDSEDRVYVVDSGNNRIQRFTF